MVDEHCLTHTLAENAEEIIRLRILLKAGFAETAGLS